MSDNLNDFKGEVNKVIDAAFKSSKGGDANWNKTLEAYSIMPLSLTVKETLLNSEMKISTGAFPIELRKVLTAIVQKHSAIHAQDPAALNLLGLFNIDAEVMKYHKKIKPFGGMSDLFKNATATSSKYTKDVAGAKQNTHRCKNCGAPRLEEMQYDECMFCGSELFEPVPS